MSSAKGDLHTWPSRCYLLELIACGWPECSSCSLYSWFISCDSWRLLLPLMQWSISLIKNLYDFALEIVRYVIRYTAAYGLLFERHSLPSCPTQAWVPLLGPPLISSQLWWTVTGSQTSPMVCFSASGLSPERWKPLKSLGNSYPQGHTHPKGAGVSW